jgi:hypothetical protein
MPHIIYSQDQFADDRDAQDIHGFQGLFADDQDVQDTDQFEPSQATIGRAMIISANYTYNSLCINDVTELNFH